MTKFGGCRPAGGYPEQSEKCFLSQGKTKNLYFHVYVETHVSLHVNQSLFLHKIVVLI